MIKKNYFYIFIFLFTINFNTFSYTKEKPTKSWRDIRDYAIVKQEFDYSCGIASLATLLNNKYNLKLKESDLVNKLTEIKGISLEELKKQESYTLLDIKKLAESLGYKATGYAIDFETLNKISPPFIVFIIPNTGNNHFSLLTKIDVEFVYLADPSWGNLKIVKSKFINIFKTDKKSTRYGKILVISEKN